MPPKPRPVEERFWSKVNKDGPISAHRPELGPCWIWTAGRNRQGYGRLNVGGRKGGAQLAPRVAWTLTFGTIPDGIHVLHHCDNPPCVRPKHLFLGTQADNTADMMGKGRHRPTTLKGSKVATAKLCEEDVREIRRLYAMGMKQAAIAPIFGVDSTMISLIVRRKWWRHVQ